MTTAVESPISRIRSRQNPHRTSALAWRFNRALQELEKAASPPVPRVGAPAYWGRLLTQFPPLEELLVRRQILNGEVLEEIGKVDTALMSHVDRLRHQGADMIGQFLELWKQTRGLNRRAEGVHVDCLPALRGEVLTWISHCRAHEREITAGFIEAHLRDRGGAG